MIDFPTLLNWLFQTAVAFVSTIAFAIIFHTPRREYLDCGNTGGGGCMGSEMCIRDSCMYANLGVVAASFFATVALAWFSRVFAFCRKTPVTVFLITGIFPLVPGAGIYYTGYHLFMSDNSQALLKGLETIKIAVAIALGIGIVLSLPAFFFTLRRSPKNTGGRS